MRKRGYDKTYEDLEKMLHDIDATCKCVLKLHLGHAFGDDSNSQDSYGLKRCPDCWFNCDKKCLGAGDYNCFDECYNNTRLYAEYYDVNDQYVKVEETFRVRKYGEGRDRILSQIIYDITSSKSVMSVVGQDVTCFGKSLDSYEQIRMIASKNSTFTGFTYDIRTLGKGLQNALYSLQKSTMTMFK